MRNIYGIRRVERVRTSLIREGYGCELSVQERTKKNVLKWFDVVGRIGDERLVRRVYLTNVEVNIERGRRQKEQ